MVEPGFTVNHHYCYHIKYHNVANMVTGCGLPLYKFNVVTQGDTTLITGKESSNESSNH